MPEDVGFSSSCSFETTASVGEEVSGEAFDRAREVPATPPQAPIPKRARNFLLSIWGALPTFCRRHEQMEAISDGEPRFLDLTDPWMSSK